MKIPESLKIGGIVYDIKISDIDDGTCGQIERNRNQIVISNDLPQTQRELTLLHEILHAINGERKEIATDAYAFGLHQVLTDNKLWR